MKSKLIENPLLSPTILISKEFVDKCNYLCRKISKLEWSGVLFYELKNNKSKDINDLVFELKDIYLLDIGTPGTTSYEEKNDEAYLDYLMSIPSTWQRGTIHSHNTMSCFFSGTDLNDLGVYCNGFNMYLSLIVNNALEFDARITHKCNVKNQVTDSLDNKFTTTEDVIYVYDPYIEIILDKIPELDKMIDKLYKENASKPKEVSTQNTLWEKGAAVMSNNNKGDLYYQSVVDNFAEEWLGLDDINKTINNTNILSKKYFQVTIDNLDQGLFNDVYESISDMGDEKDESLFYNLLTIEYA